ncbi:uncharacterized protein LOC126560124 [Anopheles maculipalpis]|uniref:uncharacterized protein LOC126560124 n=1 Tax=Anopheles maculipalpis TaxID=1496333 RepID=UPI002158A486|nr:uncharacterized protein LOC126560124 [Anopheles maculipalpis]
MSTESGSPAQANNSKLYSPPSLMDRSGRFRPVFAICMFSIHLFFAIVIVVIGTIGSTLSWPNTERDDASSVYFIIIYLRIAYWLVTYVIHERNKREFVRLAEPDFDHYRTLAVYRKAPLQIATLWNVILLTVQNQVRYLFPYDHQAANGVDGTPTVGALNPAITPQVFVIVVCALELLVLLCFYVPLVRILVDIRRSEGHGKVTDLRYRRMTDTELAEQPMEWQLERQAILIKRYRTERERLQREAKLLGVDYC